MFKNNCTRDEALGFISKLKDDVCPNINFCQQLLKLQDIIRVLGQNVNSLNNGFSDCDTDASSNAGTPQ